MAHTHHAELINPDGSHKFTNALSRETSPYLLQHAHNPVEWHAWGPEAFELARRTGKPIFLSVGYSTCYWCHVMERQVFENPRIAAVMNEHFVNVKVDREERPDVDDIYMIAVQVMTGHGGWPMSVFLTPPGASGASDKGLKPFYTGTYFPPEPTRGMPGFPQVVLSLSKSWKEQREEVVEQAEKVAEAVTEHMGRVDDPGELGVGLIQSAANGLLRTYDPEHGGFGSAPKFPTPGNLFLLMAVYRNNANADLWRSMSHTLDRMARGGMYDQVGGGFHRYSTDEKWLVPHFEKMLYDNGQLVEAYLEARAIRPDENDPGLYERVVRETCDYVLREMTDATGAFWSAQDAEVDAREGENYLWSPAQVEAAVGDAKLAELAIKMYGLDEGPNFKDPHDEAAPPANVLFVRVPLHELAKQAGRTLGDVVVAKREIDKRLLAERNKRKQPSTDDKVLTAWNGMMIAGMARAGRDLDEPRYTKAAARAADAILKHMTTADGGLLRTMRGGTAKVPAFLDDYAFFAQGLIALHHADGDERWLREAVRLTAEATRRFASPGGGYYDTLSDQADLFVRTRSTYDGAIASGNSRMILNLVDLRAATGERVYLDRAVADLQSFAAAMRRAPLGTTRLAEALLRVMTAGVEPSAAGQAPRVDSSGKREQRRVVDIEVDSDHITLGTNGEEQALAVTLRIGPDYHVNAHETGDEHLIPTTLELHGGGAIALSVTYPDGKPRKYPFADRPIHVYEGAVRLRAVLHRTGPADPSLQPKLVLKYQVCTEMSCLEPRSVELPVVIG
ncbi:MAG: DUF255 domain-containing protein [Planctomycetes bacterium]|nr:DUF255 domain-containing protein [Planctomycetota bacterium]